MLERKHLFLNGLNVLKMAEKMSRMMQGRNDLQPPVLLKTFIVSKPLYSVIAVRMIADEFNLCKSTVTSSWLNISV